MDGYSITLLVVSSVWEEKGLVEGREESALDYVT
jgi:hypothetical protein